MTGEHGCLAPALSVVVVTPDRYATVRQLVACLRSQTAREQLEIVLVSPSLAALGPDAAELADFGAVHLVEVGPITSAARARAAGVRRASAPIVAMTEEHCFPTSGWAAALIEAHRGPWAVVGPTFVNANPGVVSWAALYAQYGPWVAPAAGGEVGDLPGHNSSYKRAALLALGARLEELFEAESVLHWELRARGERLYLASAARVDHLNISRPAAFAVVQCHYGRLFGGARARGWSRPRRALYAAAAPLIPLVRLLRVAREMRRSGRLSLLPSLLPVLLTGLATGAAGEMVGYAAGVGRAPEIMAHLELHHRDRVLTDADRRAVRP